MKTKLFFTFFIVLAIFSSRAQVLYDNGALNAENNFVAGGTSWASNTITYFYSNDTPDIAGTIAEKECDKGCVQIMG